MIVSKFHKKQKDNKREILENPEKIIVYSKDELCRSTKQKGCRRRRSRASFQPCRSHGHNNNNNKPLLYCVILAWMMNKKKRKKPRMSKNAENQAKGHSIKKGNNSSNNNRNRHFQQEIESMLVFDPDIIMRLIMGKQWEHAEEEATKEHEMGNASLERTGRIPSANWSKKMLLLHIERCSLCRLAWEKANSQSSKDAIEEENVNNIIEHALTELFDRQEFSIGTRSSSSTGASRSEACGKHSKK